jgi:hypothetical protein
MKTINAIILAIILLLASISTSTVFAQKGGDDGYPVNEGYPVETTEPPEPTPDPPDPTPEPPQPTPDPPQPTPEATEATALPTASTPKPTEAPEDPHPVCEGLKTHPVLTRFAEHYHMDYEDLLVYFCEYDFDMMEIKLLLETFTRAGGELSLDEILSLRMDEGWQWNDIWHNLGFEFPLSFDESGQPEAFRKNEKRNGYNHQASNPGEDS